MKEIIIPKKKKKFQNDGIKGEGTKRLQTFPLTVLRVIVRFKLQKIMLAMCPGVPLF